MALSAVSAALLVASTATPTPTPTLTLTPTPPPTPVLIDPTRVTPGVLGFAALVFLAIAVFVIWKSMNKQLKRIDFDEDAPPPG